MISIHVSSLVYIRKTISSRTFRLPSSKFQPPVSLFLCFFLWCFQLLSRRFYFVFQSLSRNFLVCHLSGGSAPLSVSAMQFLRFLCLFFHFSVIVFLLALLFVYRIYRPFYLYLLVKTHIAMESLIVNLC